MTDLDEAEFARLAELVDEYDHAPVGQFSMTLDGLIVHANATFLSMTGYQYDELVGCRFFRDLLTPAGRIYNETHINPLLGMQAYLREIAIDVIRADGSRLPTLINSVVRLDGEGVPARVQMAAFDATERRSYERELLVAQRRIERLQRITATFAALLDAGQVAREALGELVDGIKADYGVLAFLDPSSEELPVIAVHPAEGTTAEGWHNLAFAEVEPIARVVKTAEPAFIEDGNGHAEGLPPLTRSDKAATRMAILPLVFERQVFGVLCLASTSRSDFDRDERLFLASFAGICAQAIERARLNEITVRAADQLAFLSTLSHEFEQRIALGDRAQRLVDLLVPKFADFATVEIPSIGRRPIAAQHVDPELREALLDLRESTNVDETPEQSFAWARVTGELQSVPEIPDTSRECVEDSHQLALLRRLAPRSYVKLPLVARGQLLGSVLLAMSGSLRRFGEDDLAFLTDVANRAAVALENARLLDHVQTVAQRLQRSQLPESLPTDSRFRLGAWYVPSAEQMEIGGDWYDAFMLSPDRLGLVVGDVVGHHIEAVMAMSQLRTALRAFALSESAPSTALGQLSRFAVSVPGGICATVIYAELDLHSKTLTYACAGHLPPVLATPGSAPRALWEGRSPPLGVLPDTPVTEATVELAPGAAVFLVTDGLIERRGESIDDGLQALIDRLAADALWQSGTALDELAASLLAGTQQADDVCMLTVALAESDSGF